MLFERLPSPDDSCAWHISTFSATLISAVHLIRPIQERLWFLQITSA